MDTPLVVKVEYRSNGVRALAMRWDGHTEQMHDFLGRFVTNVYSSEDVTDKFWAHTYDGGVVIMNRGDWMVVRNDVRPRHIVAERFHYLFKLTSSPP